MILKNVASQKFYIFAYTAATGVAKTGDAANITAYLSKDGAAAAQTNDVNSTEMDATNMKGWYAFDAIQAETNAEMLILAPVSATAGVLIDPVQMPTMDATIGSRASQTSVDAGLPATVDGIAWLTMWKKLVAVLLGNTDGNTTSVKEFLAQDGTTVEVMATIDGDGNRVIDLTP